MTMHGMMVSATPACSSPQLTCRTGQLETSVSVTGRVNFAWSVIRISAAKNSFQPAKKVNSAVVMTPGHGDRQHDVPQRPEDAAPVDLRRLLQRHRHRVNALRIMNSPNGRWNVM